MPLYHWVDYIMNLTSPPLCELTSSQLSLHPWLNFGVLAILFSFWVLELSYVLKSWHECWNRDPPIIFFLSFFLLYNFVILLHIGLIRLAIVYWTAKRFSSMALFLNVIVSLTPCLESTYFKEFNSMWIHFI